MMTRSTDDELVEVARRALDALQAAVDRHAEASRHHQAVAARQAETLEHLLPPELNP